MNKVAIVTDSISEMPQELADEYNIKLLSMGIVIDDVRYNEIEVDLPEYYRNLLQVTDTEKLPKSASVSLASFLEAFRELGQKSIDVVYIGHSTRLVCLLMPLNKQRKSLVASCRKSILKHLTPVQPVGLRCYLHWKQLEQLVPVRASLR